MASDPADNTLTPSVPMGSPLESPSQELVSTTLIAPVRQGHCYSSRASMRAGLGYHLERTVFREVRWPEHLPSSSVQRLLRQGARVAAAQYVARIGKMTWGLLGPARSRSRPNTVYLSAFGVNLLKIMGFEEIVRDASEEVSTVGDVSFGVTSGFLAARHVESERRGRLIIRWRWDDESDQEVFETEVRDYVPRLAGRRGTWLGRLFYRLTQANFHKVVMWGYHWWIRKNREAILLQAARELEGKAQLEAASTGGASRAQ